MTLFGRQQLEWVPRSPGRKIMRHAGNSENLKGGENGCGRKPRPRHVPGSNSTALKGLDKRANGLPSSSENAERSMTRDRSFRKQTVICETVSGNKSKLRRTKIGHNTIWKSQSLRSCRREPSRVETNLRAEITLSPR